jgi:hypothetical protein
MGKSEGAEVRTGSGTGKSQAQDFSSTSSKTEGGCQGAVGKGENGEVIPGQSYNRLLGCDLFKGVVTKRADSIYPVQLRPDMEKCRGGASIGL